MRILKKIDYNSPVVLSFVFLSFVVLILGYITKGFTTRLFFLCIPFLAIRFADLCQTGGPCAGTCESVSLY